MRTSFSIVVVLALTTACSRATSAPAEIVPGQSIQLADGQSAQVSNTTVVVQFLGANDSRCPSDVVCVTAGDAAIALSFTGAGAQRSDTLYLVRTPRSANYGSYRFEAVDLLPYPTSRGQTAPRRFTVRVATTP